MRVISRVRVQFIPPLSNHFQIWSLCTRIRHIIYTKSVYVDCGFALVCKYNELINLLWFLSFFIIFSFISPVLVTIMMKKLFYQQYKKRFQTWKCSTFKESVVWGIWENLVLPIVQKSGLKKTFTIAEKFSIFHIRCNIIMLPKKFSIFPRPMQHDYVAEKILNFSTSDAT